MNKSLIALAMLFSMSAIARDGVQPTSYDCVGPQNSSVSYETTSFSGRPLFHARFKGVQVKLPAFPEVRTQASPMGMLATVTDAHMALVDGPTYHYTLVVPQVELENTQATAKFESLLIQTAVANPFFGPSGTFVVQDNDVVPVTCTASFVVS